MGSNALATASQALQNYSESFGGFEKSAASHELPWLRKLREDGFARFSETGFPTTRDEDWRFTNPSAITRTPFQLVRNGYSLPSRKDLESFRIAGVACQLVFVDGRYAPGLSSVGKLPDGVTVGNLAVQIALDPGSVELHLGRYLDIQRDAFG